MFFSASSRLSHPFSSQKPSRSIADEMACTNPGDFIAKHTPKLIESITNDKPLTSITLDTVKRQLEAMETHFKTLPEGSDKKKAVAEAIRKSHTALADAIIAKLKEQAATSSRSRSSSNGSEGSPASTTRQSPSLETQMTQNLNFFTQSMLGRFIVAKVLQELESDSKLPASLYMTAHIQAASATA